MAKPLGPIWLIGLFFGALSLSVSVSAQDSGADRLQRLSDTQLTSLAADWDELSDRQRTQLIQETRQRMQPQTSRAPGSVVAPKAQVAPAQAARNSGKQSASRSAQTIPSQTIPSQTIPSQTIQRRRYGALVRQADGTVRSVQVQTQVIRVRDPQRAYGTGFEQRRNRNGTVRPNTRVTPVNSVSISNNVLSEDGAVSRQD